MSSRKVSWSPPCTQEHNDDWQALELLHMDLFGLIVYISIGGSKYCLVIVDDYSRFTWVFFLQEKITNPRNVKEILKTGSK
jgi:hypothetical protein